MFYIFQGCTGLSSIIIPSSVQIIGSNAFNGIVFTTIISMIENPFMISG
ncbi:MAG: leucine-rich repeat protein, partial [Bacteroidaceae bacterium]|nr:leucine-rich repeat protein [Bacteroidaceae bacterium]